MTNYFRGTYGFYHSTGGNFGIACYTGQKKGGIALGLLGGIGLVILVFVFHLEPGKPPVDVMLVIIAVVAASATLQASGGLDRDAADCRAAAQAQPKYVSIVAPFVTCLLTILCGTGHVVYTILPIIYDVAIKNNIRPERPMAAQLHRRADGYYRQPGIRGGGLAGGHAGVK